MEYDTSPFWNNVKSRCKDVGITQTQLGGILGRGRTFISSMASNNAAPSVMLAHDIAVALHTTVDVLMGDTMNTEPITNNIASGTTDMARYISLCIASKDMKQKELAKKLSRNSTALSLKLTGDDFKLSFIQEVADALDANIRLIFTDKTTGEPLI